MKLGLLLLDKENNYLVDGRLPERPSFDKELLKYFVANYTISFRGNKHLPKAWDRHAVVLYPEHADVLLSISEIDEYADVILVTVSDENNISAKEKKKFRFDKFTLMLDLGVFRIYKRKNIQGLKFDNNKLKYSLIPPIVLKALASVLTFGAKKYAPDSWKHLPNAEERYLDALYRHLEAYRAGEKKDKESGYSHLWHAITNLAFLIYFEEEKDSKCS
jgi:hypothetical protein